MTLDAKVIDLAEYFIGEEAPISREEAMAHDKRVRELAEEIQSTVDMYLADLDE